MKNSAAVQLARIASSLSLFGILLCIHMSFTLAHFLPSQSKGAMDAVFVFFFAGAVMGAVLCPLFLPLPNRKTTTPAKGICFIAFLVAVECTFRSLGFRVWLDSALIRSIMAIPEGILMTMCYGLFYLTWLRRRRVADGEANRTGRFCSLVLGAALFGSVLVRYFSVPLLEAGIAAEDSLKGAEFVFNLIKWCMIVLGMSAIASVFMTGKTDAALTGSPTTEPALKTNWPVIIRLISLASVFTILNGVLNMRMLPLYLLFANGYANKALHNLQLLVVMAAVPVFCFFAGRSISSFIRRFLPPAIVLFILVSCLPLFEEYPRFNMIMSAMVSIVYFTLWVVFTTAVVEHYAGGFWFYGISAVIFFSVVFAFLAPIISPLMPDGTEHRVLSIAIAAVFFMLLAFRLIFPKQPQPSMIPQEKRQERFPAASAFEDVFKQHGLSQREIEVANLLVKEGLGKKEIGERLYIAEGTAKLHISKIYQKFDVNNQREFMSLFVNKEQ